MTRILRAIRAETTTRHTTARSPGGSHQEAQSKAERSQVATYTVTRVRKEQSADGTHEHIEGVCTTADVHYTRKEVVDSINAGNTWKTSADGYEAVIEPIAYC